MDGPLKLMLGLVALAFTAIGGYLAQKMKNVATKEDIGELTRIVEEAKSEYSRDLERIKVSLAGRLHVSQARYLKEYEILSEVTERLVELRDAASGLRPIMDIAFPGQAKEDRDKLRYERFFKAARELYEVRENRRPFYPVSTHNAPPRP